MFTNKHFIAAIIITPILAIIAYFAVDYAVSERPHKAIVGNSYPLIAKSNCRYQSGRCTFKNGDVEFDLIPDNSEKKRIILQLNSKLPLDGVKIALTHHGGDPLPHSMRSVNEALTRWQTTRAYDKTAYDRIMVVVAIADTLYYGESATTFTTYKPGFPQTNRQ